MSVTDLSHVNLHPRRVIGRIDIKDRFFEYLDGAMRRHTKARTTGPGPVDDDPDTGGWYASVEVTDGTGADHLDFSGADGVYGNDGNGNIISVDNGDSRLNEVPFQDTNAVTYYMGVTTALVPEGISHDTDTGTIYYDRYRQEIGHLAEPTLVVDGGGTITLTLNNHRIHASDTNTDRSAVVYLKNPESSSAATAIETCTVVGNDITTTGTLGQSVVSTTASDYEVVLIGPTITRESALETTGGWAFIGTVVGGASPRTFDFEDQPSLTNLEDLSTQTNRLLTKGWIGRPSVAISGGGASVDFGVALAFINGRVRELAASAGITGFPVSGEFWISYNDASGAYEVYTTWDTANAAHQVPIFWGNADGASLVTAATSATMGWEVKEFNDPLLLTVSNDADHHGAFATLRGALAAVYSAQQGSTLSPRGAIIEIVGDVTVTAAISEPTLLSAVNVTFVGRGGGGGRGTVPGAGTAGSRIIWAFDGSLFDMSVGVPAMVGWTFKDLTLKYTGTATADSRAVISNQTGTIQGLRFERCTLDGNTVMNSVDAGSGTGALPHLVISNNGTVQRLSIVECGIYCRDAAVYQSAAAGGLVGLRIIDSEFQNNDAGLFSTSGIVEDASTGSVTSKWRIRGCDAEGIRGTVISSRRIDGLWITECDLQTSTVDEPVLDLGRDNAAADIDSIWISNNRISRVTMTNPASDVILIRGEGAVRIFIDANEISDGDAIGATARAVSFEANTVAMSGPVVFGNSVHTVAAGVAPNSGDLRELIMFGNSIITTEGTARIDVEESIVFGNHLESLSGSAPALSVVGDFHSIFGNVLTMGANVAAALSFDSGCQMVAVVGNVVPVSSMPLLLDGDNHTVVGNIFFEAGSAVNVVTGSQTSTLVGNQLNEVVLDGSGNIMAGNNVSTIVTYDAVNEIFVGNRADQILAANARDKIVFVGNHLTTNVAPGAADDCVVTGNILGGATYDFELLDSAVTGNCFFEAATVTLNAASADVAVVGNYILDAAVIDAGTGNVVQDNSSA